LGRGTVVASSGTFIANVDDIVIVLVYLARHIIEEGESDALFIGLVDCVYFTISHYDI